MLRSRLVSVGAAVCLAAGMGATGIASATSASADTSGRCSIWVAYDPWSQRQGGHGVVFNWYAIRPIGSPVWLFYAKRDVQNLDNRSRYEFGNFRVWFDGQMKPLTKENTYTYIGSRLTTPASLPFYAFQLDNGGSNDHTRSVNC